MENPTFKSYKNNQFLDIGSGPVIILLHGLFGTLSNFSEIIKLLEKDFRIILPILPLFSYPIKDTNLNTLSDYLDNFINFLELEKYSILGNSLGGHLAILHALNNQNKCVNLILTASSGLFEESFGNSYPRRDYEWVKNKVKLTFGNPILATDELVKDVHNTVNDRNKAIRIIRLAKSATRNNLSQMLKSIYLNTLLIWGNKDNITPPFVAKQFKSLLPNSTLHFIEDVGHAPMMEAPQEFYTILIQFLKNQKI